MAETKVITREEKLASELAKLRLAPGNECLGYAKKILDMIAKLDGEEIKQMVDKDDLDVSEILENDKAIMTSLLGMTKMLKEIHERVVPQLPKGEKSVKKSK